MAGPFRVVFLAFVASFFFLGLHDLLTNFEKNGCEMTYMYEYPQYLEVPLDKEVKKKYPRYNLNIYGEGSYAAELRKSNYEVSGVPVLFIPGSTGSVRQVRSLGSVAYRMAKDHKLPIHFNYFSIDYNEELSGLYGGILWQQTEFAHECIKKILSLYSKATNKPKSVIVVGHSMGGILARGLFALPTFDPDLVTTIITQATPHQAAPIALDSHLHDYYEYVNEFWRSHTNTTLKYVTVLSTGGGFRDILVPSGLTHLHNIHPDGRSLSTTTMSVPRGWVSTDHLCHVWCKQIVLATQRALYDMLDKTTKQVAVSVFYRMNALIQQFAHNPGPKSYKPAYDENIKLDSNIKWELRKKPSWKLLRENLNMTRYSVMPLLKDMTQETLYGVTVVSNIDTVHWIGACALPPAEEKCASVTNLSPYANLIPPSGSNKKALLLHPDKLQSFTHLVVVLPKSNTRIEVIAEQYNMTKRNIRYTLPGLSSFLLGFTDHEAQPEVVVKNTEPSATFYNISLDGMNNVLDTYTVHVVVNKCSEKHAGPTVGNLLKFHVPWSSEDTYSFIKYGENGNISAKLQLSKPSGHHRNAEVHIFLHPGCSYRIVVTRSWMEMFGQFVRNYGTLLPCFFVIQMLMTLSWQLKQLDEEGIVGSFGFAHARYAQPWRVVPIALLFRFLFCYPEENSFSSKLGLPPDDMASMAAKGLWLTPIPIFLYLTAYAITELYGFTVYGVIAGFARIFGKCFQSCLYSRKAVRLMTGCEYLVLAAAALLAGTVCGALGILIVYFIYIAKMLVNYNWARKQEEKLGDWAWNRFNVNFSLFLLTLMMLVLNAPSLIMWMHNFKYSVVLENDPSRWTGVAMAVATLFLTYSNFPIAQTELFGVLSGIYYISSVLMVIYTMESSYRIQYFVSANLLNLALPLVIISSMANGKQKPSKTSNVENEDIDKESEDSENDKQFNIKPVEEKKTSEKKED